MWEMVATEMGLPWRAVEAMHWQMGQEEMASRANVPVFQPHGSGRGTRSPGSDVQPQLAGPHIRRSSSTSSRRQRAESAPRQLDRTPQLLHLAPVSEAANSSAATASFSAFVSTATGAGSRPTESGGVVADEFGFAGAASPAAYYVSPSPPIQGRSTEERSTAGTDTPHQRSGSQSSVLSKEPLPPPPPESPVPQHGPRAIDDAASAPRPP